MNKTQFNEGGWAQCLSSLSKVITEELATIENNGGKPFHFLALALAWRIAQEDNPMRVLCKLTEEVRDMIPQVLEDMETIVDEPSVH